MIEKRFSAAAQTYDRHARPQRSLAHSVCDVLPEIYPEEILELGCGTGQLTRMLFDRFPDVPIDAVDLSDKMIEHSRKTFGRFPQARWIVGDAQIWQGQDPYPLIVSSAALHWTSNLQKTFENIFQCLEKDGIFSLGMMLKGTLNELWNLRREIAPEKTPEPPLPTLDNLVDGLHAAGFKILRKKKSTEEVTYDHALAFLQAIHEQGVTGVKIASTHTPLTRGEIIRLIESYQNRHCTPDGVTATYKTATLLLTRSS